MYTYQFSVIVNSALAFSKVSCSEGNFSGHPVCSRQVIFGHSWVASVNQVNSKLQSLLRWLLVNDCFQCLVHKGMCWSRRTPVLLWGHAVCTGAPGRLSPTLPLHAIGSEVCLRTGNSLQGSCTGTVEIPNFKAHLPVLCCHLRTQVV